MTDRVPLRCRCGAVSGHALDVSPRTGNRIVCYCDDCQAYARWLDRADTLDPHGGTDIFQVTPATVRIEHGADELRGVRLSDRGMIRWYAGCCRTPVGNTLASSRGPFVGIVHSFMDCGSDERDRALGEASFVQGRFAVGTPPAHVHPTVSLPTILRSVWLLVRGFLTGAHRPSPFFDAQGRPRIAPQVLTAAERDALRPDQELAEV